MKDRDSLAGEGEILGLRPCADLPKEEMRSSTIGLLMAFESYSVVACLAPGPRNAHLHRTAGSWQGKGDSLLDIHPAVPYGPLKKDNAEMSESSSHNVDPPLGSCLLEHRENINLGIKLTEQSKHNEGHVA